MKSVFWISYRLIFDGRGEKKRTQNFWSRGSSNSRFSWLYAIYSTWDFVVIYTGRVAIKRRDVETMTGGEVLSLRIYFFSRGLALSFCPRREWSNWWRGATSLILSVECSSTLFIHPSKHQDGTLQRSSWMIVLTHTNVVCFSSF